MGGNLAASFVLFTSKEVETMPLALLLAMSAVDLLKQEGLSPTFKWPNDLHINGRKIAGVLAESKEVRGEPALGVVLGIGLNVNALEEELSQVGQSATSLFIEKGKKYEISPLVDRLAALFEGRLDGYSKKGFSPFISEFQSLSGIEFL